MAAIPDAQAGSHSTTTSCPICQGATSLSVDNRHRPFCSARCQMVDLGNWLGERYVVPGRQGEAEDEQKPLTADPDEPT